MPFSINMSNAHWAFNFKHIWCSSYWALWNIIRAKEDQVFWLCKIFLASNWKTSSTSKSFARLLLCNSLTGNAPGGDQLSWGQDRNFSRLTGSLPALRRFNPPALRRYYPLQQNSICLFPYCSAGPITGILEHLVPALKFLLELVKS